MLRTGRLPAPHGGGLPPLRPRALTRRRECCYRGPWRLPGPDSHRLAAVSLSLGYVVALLLSVVLGARAAGRTLRRNHRVVAARGRPAWLQPPPGGGVDADPRRPGQGQGPPQAVPQGRHAPLTRPAGGVGPGRVAATTAAPRPGAGARTWRRHRRRGRSMPPTAAVPPG